MNQDTDKSGSSKAPGSRIGHECPDGEDTRPPGEVLRQALGQVGELVEYFSYYLSAKADGLKLSLRDAVIYLALGLIGLATAAAVVVVAVVLVCTGVGTALGQALGIPWLGNIIAGVALLAVVGLGLRIGIVLYMRQSHRQTMERYERRKQRQRARYGRNIRERAQQRAK